MDEPERDRVSWAFPKRSDACRGSAAERRILVGRHALILDSLTPMRPEETETETSRDFYRSLLFTRPYATRSRPESHEMPRTKECCYDGAFIMRKDFLASVGGRLPKTSKKFLPLLLPSSIWIREDVPARHRLLSLFP